MVDLIKNLFAELRTQFDEIADTMKTPFMLYPMFEEISCFIKESEESNSLSQEEFCNTYIEEIEICKDLGRRGWVVSEHINPRIIKSWYLSPDDMQIANYFEENDNQKLKQILGKLQKVYTELPYSRYFFNGVEAFYEENYMTTAMYLVALIESRMNYFMAFPKKVSYGFKYSERGFETHVKEVFDGQDSFFKKRIFVLDMYPSVIVFLNRLFVEGEYTFEKGIEPPYINRNWLLHGRSMKEIERYECIQLFNALSTIEFLFNQQ